MSSPALSPIAWLRWTLLGAAALGIGVLLCIARDFVQLPLLSGISNWLLISPLMLAWGFALGGRVNAYGTALNHCRFLEFEAQRADQAWEGWAGRQVVVHASCLMLPDQACAAALLYGSDNPVGGSGEARRIADLPARLDARSSAGLKLLLSALASALRDLPFQPVCRATLLTDADPEHYPELQDLWLEHWSGSCQPPNPILEVTATLSYDWINRKIKSGSPDSELILVVQVLGGERYSDGLAAFLLRPELPVPAGDLPIKGSLLRHMPLDANNLEGDLKGFFRTQVQAQGASAVLANIANEQSLLGQVISAARAAGAPLDAQSQWNQERLGGLPGPFGHWLVAALAVDLVEYRQRPLLVIGSEASHLWIGTVGTGVAA